MGRVSFFIIGHREPQRKQSNSEINSVALINFVVLRSQKNIQAETVPKIKRHPLNSECLSEFFIKNYLLSLLIFLASFPFRFAAVFL